MAFLQQEIISPVYDSHSNNRFGGLVDIDIDLMVAHSITDGVVYGGIGIFERGGDGLWSIDTVMSQNNWTPSYATTASTSILFDTLLFTLLIGNKTVYSTYKYDGTWTLAFTGFTGSADDNKGDEVNSTISSTHLILGYPEDVNSRGLISIRSYDSYGELDTSNNVNITFPTAVDGDRFGSAVATFEDYLVVAAEGYESDTGVVFIYHKDQGGIDNWGLQDTIIAPDAAENDKFGFSVSIFDGYLAVGSPFHEAEDGSGQAGCVYIYKQVDTKWYLLSQNYSVSSNLEADNYGYSIKMKDGYLLVGAPGVNGSTGAAYLYSKDENWSLIQTLEADDGELGDKFGQSVSLSNKTIIVGAPYRADGSEVEVGATYVFDESDSKYTYGQEFAYDSTYLPTKASAHLRIVGKNYNDYFSARDNYPTIIDATNFSNIISGDNNVSYDDMLLDYTGNGYMTLSLSGVNPISDSDIIEYPLRTESDGKYYLWIRGTNSVEIYFDGIYQSDTIESDPSDMEIWKWYKFELVVPDSNTHSLGLKLKGLGDKIDKLYLDRRYYVPKFNGPEYSKSPYLTIHSRIHTSVGYPSDALEAYAYRVSFKNMPVSDWYNFDFSRLSGSITPSVSPSIDPSGPTGDFYVVMSVTGTNPTNYIVWSKDSSDDNSILPSVSRAQIIRGEISDDSNTTEITNKDMYLLRQSESDLYGKEWTLDYNNKFAIKIYSDYPSI